METKRTNTMRSAEEKAKLVEDFYRMKCSYKIFAAKRGIHPSVFHRWIAKYDSGGVQELRSKTGRGKTSGNKFAALHSSKSLSELERLKLELMRKDIEIERLKKGYIVKGAGSKKVFVSIRGKSSK